MDRIPSFQVVTAILIVDPPAEPVMICGDFTLSHPPAANDIAEVIRESIVLRFLVGYPGRPDILPKFSRTNLTGSRPIKEGEHCIPLIYVFIIVNLKHNARRADLVIITMIGIVRIIYTIISEILSNVDREFRRSFWALK